MIIGILQCDTVLPQYQAEFGNYATMIIDLLNPLDSRLQFQIYDVEHNQYPSNINACDAYITTGSKASVYDGDAWIQPLAQYITELHEQQKPLIGICFGHQLIAQTLGGQTRAADVGWGVGVATTPIHSQQTWMQPASAALNLVVSHKDQVTHLPKNAQHLASTPFCPNAIYQIDQHILSMQGHPEFSKAYSRTMMQHRAKVIPPHTLQTGLASLDKTVHDATMAHWMINFIKHCDQ